MLSRLANPGVGLGGPRGPRYGPPSEYCCACQAGSLWCHRLPHEGLISIYDRPPYDTSLVEQRRCTRDCLVSYDGNLYSAPAEYATQQMTVKVNENDDLSILNQQGEVVARHRLALGSRQRIIVAEHYADLRPDRRARKRPQARQVSAADLAPIPWPDAPMVDARPLSVYQGVVEVAP